MKSDKFVFSTWVYNDIREFTPDEIDVWVECGMNIPLAPKTYIGRDDPSVLIPWLDRAEKLGIKLIANYEELSYGDYIRLGEEAYIARVKPLYEALGSHPALFGFYIGDEPSDRKSYEACQAIIKIHKELAPHLTPFLNYTGNMVNHSSEEFGGRDLCGWIKYVTDTTGTDTVCFDQYDQMINDHGGMTMFFRGVRDMVEAGKGAGVDVWGCLLSSGGHVYKAPNEAEIRWQIHMAAALGLRGVLWFRFYDRDFAIGSYGSPIDEFGNRTEAYYGMLRTQRRFSNHFGEKIMHLNHKKTYSVRLDRGVFPMFGEGDHELIKKITADDETIVSFFDGDDGEEYMCVCNSEYHHYGVVRFTIDPGKVSLRAVRWNGREYSDLADGDENKPGDEELELVLHPAGFEMFKLERK